MFSAVDGNVLNEIPNTGPFIARLECGTTEARVAGNRQSWQPASCNRVEWIITRNSVLLIAIVVSVALVAYLNGAGECHPRFGKNCGRKDMRIAKHREARPLSLG